METVVDEDGGGGKDEDATGTGWRATAGAGIPSDGGEQSLPGAAQQRKIRPAWLQVPAFSGRDASQPGQPPPARASGTARRHRGMSERDRADLAEEFLERRRPRVG
jgi:hypothetical protein